MDDMYTINAAKTEVREGYNHADVDRQEPALVEDVLLGLGAVRF